MMSDINTRYLDIGQASGVTADAANIVSRRRTPQ